MAGLEVEHVDDPGAKLAAFSVARIVEAVQHPNADRLRVCQVETKDGLQGDRLRRAERPGRALSPSTRRSGPTSPAPASPWSRGRCAAWSPTACCARPPSWRPPRSPTASSSWPRPGRSARRRAEALGLEAVIDFEVTPNRPDWLGVAGIARDLAAAGRRHAEGPVGRRRSPGAFPCPIDIRARRLRTPARPSPAG